MLRAYARPPVRAAVIGSRCCPATTDAEGLGRAMVRKLRRCGDLLVARFTGASVGAVRIRRRLGVLVGPQDLPRVVVDHAPLSVFMDKHVGRDQPAATEVLLAEHERDLTEALNPRCDAADRRRAVL